MHRAAALHGHQASTQVLLEALSRAAKALGKPLEVLLQEGIVAKEGLLAQSLSQWAADGACVLDADEALVKALSVQDAPDLKGNLLFGPLPTSMLIHFGAQPGYRLAGGGVVESVLLLQHADVAFARVLILGRCPGPWHKAGVGESQMLRFDLVKSRLLQISEAVEAAVELDVADLRDAAKKASMRGNGAEFPGLSEKLQEGIRREIDAQYANMAVYKRALQLATWTMAFADSHPEACEERWEAAAPEALVRLGEEGEGAQAQQAARALREQGYLLVQKVAPVMR